MVSGHVDITFGSCLNRGLEKSRPCISRPRRSGCQVFGGGTRRSQALAATAKASRRLASNFSLGLGPWAVLEALGETVTWPRPGRDLAETWPGPKEDQASRRLASNFSLGLDLSIEIDRVWKSSPGWIVLNAGLYITFFTCSVEQYVKTLSVILFSLSALARNAEPNTLAGS